MPQKEKIRKMFDDISGDYDRLNHLMSMGIDKTWRRRAMRAIFSGIQPVDKTAPMSRPAVVPRAGSASNAGENAPLKILDVACGTGDFSIDMARYAKRHGEAVNPGVKIDGLDLSSGMLAVMDRKVKAAGLGDVISKQVGDCLDMPFPDASFDRVTIAFGIRNFEDREGALVEIRRVLKPKGKLVILELSVPSAKVIRSIYNLYFLHFLPWIGGMISGDKAAYQYLPASVLAFPPKDKFMATLRSCGYKDVRHKAFTFGICRMYVAEN